MVKQRREELKLSQRDFATRLKNAGMIADAPAISRIENGTRSLRLAEAVTIAAALDAQLVDLLGLRAFQSKSESLLAQMDIVLGEYRKVSETVSSAASNLRNLSHHARGVLDELGTFDESLVPEKSVASGRLMYKRRKIEQIASSSPLDLLLEMAPDLERRDGEHPEEA